MADATYLRDLVPRALRDAIATLEGPAPSAEVVSAYREQHPAPTKTRKSAVATAVTDRLITVCGESLTARGWAKKHGQPTNMVAERIAAGWHPQIAVIANRDADKEYAHQNLEKDLAFCNRAEVLPEPARSHKKTGPTGAPHGNASLLIEIDGVTKNACAWSSDRGFYPQKVSNRVAAGWHPRAAVLGVEGETKFDAHARLNLTPAFTCPTKSKAGTGLPQPRLTQRTPKPSLVASCAVSLPNATAPNGHMLSASEAEALGMALIRLAGQLREKTK